MSRISKAFENQKAFIAFVTGGDPDLETTEALIPQMAAAGADLIEIGIPFSDPIAEGAVIQAADERALRAGTTTDKLFDMVKRVRQKVDVPLVFMTYINPVYTYGTEKFVKKCAECGIDGMIIPDVPFEEKEEVSGACEAAGIELISMIAPTSHDRINMIASQAKGFLYCVSSLGVTGVRSSITTNIKEMVDQVKEVSDIPCAIGFGIATPEQAQEMAAVSDGAIVGSAIVRIIAQYGKNCIGPVCDYIKDMKAAVAAA
ncbi:MAG: tryptophan synthase subunit alpha [Lachnospiraceae bacterium]|nr:tryptophan synthase subunit alpha [Lachnospiraceae bacterium]